MVSLSNHEPPLLRQAQDEREEYVSLCQGRISPGGSASWRTTRPR